ncbi:MAG: ribonuclease III [Rickettsiales bacterium]
MLEQKLGYHFNDSALLELALTHPSLGKDTNNQRLEFLGDAVLGLVIAKMLYAMFPDEEEGDLARRQSALVRGETLATIAQSLSLGDYIKLTDSEAAAGGRDNATNLEDAMEALIGAIYLDGGEVAAETFITARWTEIAKNTVAPPKDAKTALQEWAQGRKLPVPSYNLLDTVGPAHAPEFTIEVTVKGHPPAQAKANSKRAAEQMAAGILLEQLTNE